MSLSKTLPDYLQQNYFELFQVPVAFDVNQEVLKNKQQDFQKHVHPDNYANTSQQQQMLAMQVSTQVNNAYRTLSNDLQRAIYLLQLNEIDINAETDTQMPMEFLIKQMEVREQLSEVSSDEKGLLVLDSMLAAIHNDRQALVDNITQCFQAADLASVRDYVRQFQFVEKLQHEITQKTASIEDALMNE